VPTRELCRYEAKGAFVGCIACEIDAWDTKVLLERSLDVGLRDDATLQQYKADGTAARVCRTLRRHELLGRERAVDDERVEHTGRGCLTFTHGLRHAPTRVP